MSYFNKEKTTWILDNESVRCVCLIDHYGFKTYVTETPGGLFIQGDASIGPLGGCGTHDAKPLAWLISGRGEYLYDRFLKKAWSGERFREEVAALTAEEIEDCGYDPNEIQNILESHDRVGWIAKGEDSAYNAWFAAGGEGEDFPGYNYDERDCRLLDEVAACVTWLLQPVPTEFDDLDIPHAAKLALADIKAEVEARYKEAFDYLVKDRDALAAELAKLKAEKSS